MAILIVEGLTKVYRKAGSIAVVDEENNRVEVSLPDLELVVIVGERVRITSSAIITLLSQGVPVVFLSGRSDAYGVLFDVIQIGSVTIREAQYNCFSSTSCRLAYSKPVILSKLKGFYNVLRYEYKYYKEQLKNFEQLKYSILEVIESVKNANDVDELRNLEAQGSRYFWSLAANLIPEKYGFTGRKPFTREWWVRVFYGCLSRPRAHHGDALAPSPRFSHGSREPEPTNKTLSL